MPAITEFNYIPLKPGSDVHDPSTVEGAVLAAVLANGSAHQSYWGHLVEKPHDIYLLLDSTAIDNHGPHPAQPSDEAIQSIVDPAQAPLTCRIAFQPHPPKPLLAPVTEVFMGYFVVDGPEGDGPLFESQFKTFVHDLLEASTVGLSSDFSTGWSLENVDYKGDKMKLLVAVCGWASVEAHKAAEKTQVFGESLKKLTVMPKAFRVSHVSFKSG